MSKHSHKRSRGFSLLELVIVVVILGIIAAIAIPRMSRGSAGAADSALSSNLAVLRNAIDLYAAEHGGSFPGSTTIADELILYTDSASATATVKDTTHIYGPYLRKVPPLPLGAKKGCTGIADATAAGIGWIYDATPGTIKANCTDSEKDTTGKAYNTY